MLIQLLCSVSQSEKDRCSQPSCTPRRIPHTHYHHPPHWAESSPSVQLLGLRVLTCNRFAKDWPSQTERLWKTHKRVWNNRNNNNNNILFTFIVKWKKLSLAMSKAFQQRVLKEKPSQISYWFFKLRLKRKFLTSAVKDCTLSVLLACIRTTHAGYSAHIRCIRFLCTDFCRMFYN